MSWSVSKLGRADKLATSIREIFEKTTGCPAGSAEEAVKNNLGSSAECLCQNLIGNPVVRIEANGSAWNDMDKSKSQFVSFKFETMGDFVE